MSKEKEETTHQRLLKIESTIEKTFEDVCKKKKVTIEDLQGWLVG